MGEQALPARQSKLNDRRLRAPVRHPALLLAVPAAGMQAPMAEKCVLLSGTFASLVQLSLAAIALATLLYKRHLERPRRPWLVWTLDVSKQGLGALYAHVLNIFIAEGLHSRGGTASDEVRPVRMRRRVPCECCGVPLPFGRFTNDMRARSASGTL